MGKHDPAKALADIRTRLGLNRKEMAKRLREPYSSYTRWESGERMVPGDVLLKAQDLVAAAPKPNPKKRP